LAQNPAQEAGENIQPDRPIEKQGVGIFMNNIFNGFNAGFKKQWSLFRITFKSLKGYVNISNFKKNCF
jgi:hypothetical protein